MSKNNEKVEKVVEENIRIPKANTDYIRRKYLNISYADLSETQKLDIYLPDEGDGPFPVIVSIHGGAFAIGDKDDIQIEPMLKGLRRGYAVVGVNYRLSGEAKFPAAVHDVKAAIRWIKANAENYKLDRNKIAVWGGSAGGNLSAMIGVSANVSELEDLSLGNAEQTSNVQAVVDWFGPTDFLKMDEHLAELNLGPQDHNDEDSPESRYIGAKITDVPELVKRANPITYVTSDVPPFLIQHGDRDHLVPVQQSILLVEKLKEVLGYDSEKINFDILNGADHDDPAFKTESNLNRVYAFLDKYLK